MEEPGISVVVPVFRSTDSLVALVDRVGQVLRPMGEYEVILVDDGSPAATWEAITGIVARTPQVRGVRLGRNFGQHSALVAGVRQARYPITVTIDDDLQNPPEEIPRLLAALEEGDLDVVYGVPEQMQQSLPRRLAGRITRKALGSGLGQDAALDFSSFRAFRTRGRDAFASDLGTNVSLDALLTWGASRFGSIRVRHDLRAEGTSNYTYRRLLRFAIDTTTGYSTAPLQFASLLGFATSFLGFLALVWVVIVPLVIGRSVEGFPFLASTIAIFSGVQLLTLGIIGEYLARMHFRVMRKPTYVIREIADPLEGRAP
ncbi:MAG: glycosyltransferase family 2 protein [Actinomycetales bacterium]|nr:glycosyltransferase family 2 protein [Actinomycetales bacterium]